jgi:DNA repair protein RadC
MFHSSQLPLPVFDVTDLGRSTSRGKKRGVERTLARLRALHEELNAALYAHPTERPQINQPRDAADLLAPFMASLEHEEMWVVLLDTRNRVKSLVRLYQGTVNFTSVRTGEVFRQAVADNAAAIIVAHNHPSGDPTPSPDDVGVTHSIIQAGKLLDIEVIDHLVVCSGIFVSLKERGLGFD